VHVVLLGAPPYPNHARSVQIAQVSNTSGRLLDEVSAADVLALREHGGAIENVTTAWSSSVSLSGGSLPERARMVFTDSRAFAMLGTPPDIGRLPSLADEAPDAPPVVLLGHALWVRQFASDRSVLGQPLKIDGHAYTVIGVMPQGFRFPAPYWSGADLWLLRGAADTSWPATRDGNLLAFGLVAEGATLGARSGATASPHRSTRVSRRLDKSSSSRPTARQYEATLDELLCSRRPVLVFSSSA
jgi:hypothetical protein